MKKVFNKKVIVILLVMVVVATAAYARGRCGFEMWSWYRGVDVFLNSYQVDQILSESNAAVISVISSLGMPAVAQEAFNLLLSFSGTKASLERAQRNGALISIQFVPSLKIASISSQ